MSYNAIIRQRDDKIVGKVFLEDLKSLPPSWQVKYRNRIISKNSDLKTILCDETVPLSIYTYQVDEGSFIITVRPTWGKEFDMSVRKNYKIETLKEMIYEMEGIPIESQWDLFNPEYLFECCRKGYFYMGLLQNWGTLGEYKFKPGIDITLPLALRGSGLAMVDLEGEKEQVTANGEPFTYGWEECYFGLNLYGTCDSSACVSRYMREGLTIYRAGYTNLRLKASGRKNFLCGACSSRFSPTHFLISCGCALFRYRMRGSLFVHTKVMEALGEVKDYSQKGAELIYDVIEISCVRLDESFLICSHCDKPIKWRRDVVLYDCCHAVHRTCMEDDGCEICRAVLMDAKTLVEEVDSLDKPQGPGNTNEKE